MLNDLHFLKDAFLQHKRLVTIIPRPTDNFKFNLVFFMLLGSLKIVRVFVAFDGVILLYLFTIASYILLTLLS